MPPYRTIPSNEEPVSAQHPSVFYLFFLPVSVTFYTVFLLFYGMGIGRHGDSTAQLNLLKPT